MPVDPKILDNIAGHIKDKNERVAHLIAMLYGNSGSGKTVLAMMIAQAITPADKEILIVDTSNGWVSIPNHPEIDYRYDVMPFISREQVMAIAEGITTGHPKYIKYGCLILDEYSTMADEDLMALVERRADKDKEKDRDEPTWPDRNAGDNRMKKMLNKSISNYHLITVAHEREYKNKNKQSMTGPDFADQLRVKVQRPMHLVGYVKAVLKDDATGGADFDRFVQVHGSQFVTAKSRIGGLKIQEDFPSLVAGIAKWLNTDGQLGANVVTTTKLPTESAANSLID
jgi:energy-coupling factor transporter ATP-binding protein EcfA2